MRLCNRSVAESLEPRLFLSVNPQFVFGSYLGASAFESGYGMAPDGKGGVWITGETGSTDFSTPGGFDTTYNGSADAFVAHVTAGGTLAFASYLGGNNRDIGRAIAPDGTGGVWVTGETRSDDFPTPSGFDTTHNGGFDAFVAHVSADGMLAFASYLGGSGNDFGNGLATDDAGGVWITGQTSSSMFPTPGGFDTTYNGGLSDIFVARVTSGGTHAFGSYSGGSSSDAGYGICRDGLGGVWLTGETSSNNFPTPGGFDTTFNGGGNDGFVSHVTAGGTLAFASYLGGGDIDYAYDLAPDGAGGAWVTGQTYSGNFPTPGGFDTTLSGATDAFVARVTLGGTLAFASYLGGVGYEFAFGIASDADGVWLSGDTASADFPTPAGFDTTYNGGADDAFIARVSAGGALTFGSYLGGGSDDRSSGMTSDGAGGTWLTGKTNSADFPTPGGFDTTYDNIDAFIVHISEDTTAPTVITSEFAFASAPQSIRITFSENVSASLSLDDFTLENLTTGQTIPSKNLALSYNTASNIATITFDYPYGALPDGTYRATLLAAGITDAAGNPLTSDHILNFFFLQGDADHNGRIDGADYARIDSMFNQQSTLGDISGWSNGDFDYNGRIDGADYALIDAAFNSQDAALRPARLPRRGVR